MRLIGLSETTRRLKPHCTELSTKEAQKFPLNLVCFALSVVYLGFVLNLTF